MANDEALTERALTRVGVMLKDKWKLDSLIGVGGMAAVYAATHRNSKRVAVKMLHPELSLDSAIKQRFLREGYVANQVGHKGAVTVDDDDVDDDGSAFLVMELLEGEPLDVRMNRKGGILPVAEVLALADQLLDTLACAHDNGIVHRDLKPENLFLTKDGVLKVLDFGIARLMEMSGPTTATQAGSVMGTPAFMAPEQARGRWTDVDTRTDLWAVGATMFTLITGRLVHEAETVQEALVLAVTQRAPSIGSIDPGLPFSVVDAIDRALIYEKECRWQDAHSMKAAVRAAHRDIRGTSTMVMPVPSVPHHDIPPFELTPTSARSKSSGNVSVSTGPGVSATVAGPTASTAGRESRVPRRRALLAFAAGGVLALIALVVVAMSTLSPHDRVGQPLAQPALETRDALEVQQSEQRARTAPELPPAPQPVTVKGAVEENVQPASGARPTSTPTAQSRPKPRAAAPKPKKAPAGTVDDPFSTRF